MGAPEPLFQNAYVSEVPPRVVQLSIVPTGAVTELSVLLAPCVPNRKTVPLVEGLVAAKSPLATRLFGVARVKTEEPVMADIPDWIELEVPPPGQLIAGEAVAPAVVPAAPETVVEETSVFPEGVENLTL